MKKENTDIPFRKILVAMDTSGHSRSALEAAAQLAKLSEAELRGLFVHDENWYRISHLTITNEISEITGERRNLPSQYMKQQIQLMENRIRQYMKTITRKFDINHSWSSTRGAISDELLRAAKKSDLITIGRSGHSHKKEYKLGKTARTLIRKSDKPVLLIQEGLTLNKPVIVIYDGTPAGQRSLDLGLQLSRKNDCELSILILSNRSENVQNRNREVEQKIEDTDIPVMVYTLEQDDIWNVTQIINGLRDGLLIIPKNQPLIKGEWLEKIFQLAKCPLLLIN